MTKRQYIVVIAVPLIMIVTLASILSSGILDTLEEDRIENVKIEVSYLGAWEGMLYNNEEVQGISGFTKKTIIVFRPDGDEWTLSFEAVKKDDTMAQLEVVVKLINGTTLGETETVDPYGKVSVSLAIE